ncbi:hypothetical protein BGW37DRAFT_516279 [Umbelopsis sp. PMI_123]|nr:hypothetical protein BGW37DRAFT_516279 [Umbelopsis sp. PMI_123]
MTEATTGKRKHSDEPPELEPSSSKKQAVEQPDLLTQLTTILDQINDCSTEIPALYLSTLKSLMQQIEENCADESNTKAREIMNESERCLEEWFENLVDRYGADEEFILESDGTSDEDQLAIALALADEDEEDEEIDIDSIHNSPTENSPKQPVMA